MSSTIDNKVVEMEFDNADFERGIATSIASLEKLKQSLNFEGAVKGFDALADFNNSGAEGLKELEKSAQKVQSSFSTMQVVGYTAISELTKGVMHLGGKLLSGLAAPLAQIDAGGKRRAQNIEQARFQMKGLGLDVEEAMRNSLDAVDGTAYGLDAAAKAAGQLAASGVGLGKDMTTSLRGIAGVAAMTNSGFEDISNIFTTVASNGRLMTMQLRQMSSRGLNATAVLAKALGKTEAQIGEMTTKGQISFEMFSKAMSDAFGDQASKANDTYAGSLANVQSALSRIGAKFYAPYYENMRQTLNSLRLVLNQISAGLDPMFQMLERLMILSRTISVKKLDALDFSKMGDGLMRVLIPTIDILINLGTGLSSVFKAIGTAWKNVFPPASITPIVHVLEYIAKLTSGFGLGEENLVSLTHVFEGFFSLIKIGTGAIALFLKTAGKILGTINGFIEPIITPLILLTGIIGDFIKSIVYLLSSGVPPIEAFSIAFESLQMVLSAVSPKMDAAGKIINSALEGIGKGVSFVAAVIKNIDLDFRPLTVYADGINDSFAPLTNQNGNIFDRAANGIRTGLTNMKGALSIADSKFTNLLQTTGEVIAKVFDGIGRAAETLKPALEATGKVLSYFFNLIKVAFKDVNAIDVINTGFFAALVLTIRNFLKPIKNFSESVVGLMDAARGALESYQDRLQPSLLVAIGAAVLMLAGAFILMAQVPKEKIVGTLAAVSILLAELTGAMLLLSHKVGDKGVLKLAFAMTVLSTAVMILAKAVSVLGQLNLKEAAIGVAGISILLWELVAISVVLKKAEADMLKGSASLLFFSSSLYIMAYAVKNLGSMDIETLKTGLLSIASLIVMLGLFMKSTEKSMAQMPAFAAGLLLMAAALNLLVLPLVLLGKIPWQLLVQGLTVITATLTIVAFAANAMQNVAPQMTKLGAGLLLLAIALNLLIAPLLILSIIPMDVLGRGLLILTGLLALLATMAVLIGPIQGPIVAVAAGLTLLAIAVNLLLIPLITLGALPFNNIVNGLTALAGLFLVLGIAAAALAPISGGLLVVAGGLALIGLAANLAGVGFALLAVGVNALGLSLAGLATVLPVFLKSITDLAAQLIKSVEVVIISIVNSLGAILAALSKALLQVIIDSAPKLFETLGILLDGLIQLIRDKGPAFIDLGMTLIMDFLHGIESRAEDFVSTALGIVENLLKGLADGIPGLAKAGSDVVIAFLDAIAKEHTRIVDAAFKMVIDLITGMTDTMEKRGPELSTAISDLMGTMLKTAIDVITSPINGVLSIGRDIVSGILTGMKDKLEAVKEGAQNLGTAIIEAIRGPKGVDSHSDSKEGIAIGVDVANGLGTGLLKNGKALSAAELTSGDLLNVFKQKLDKLSPLSEEAGDEAGENLTKGVAAGISKGSSKSTEAAKKAAEEALKAIHDTTETISVSEGKYIVDGIIIGMVSKQPNMYEASKFLAQAIQKGLIEEASQFTGVGDTNATAFLKGLSDEEIIAKAWDAGVEVSSSAWEGAKDTAEAMEAAGTAAGQAYINGLNKAAEDARKRSEDISKMASSGQLAKANQRALEEERKGLRYNLNELMKLTDEEAKKYWEYGGGVGGKIVVEEMRNVGKESSAGLAKGIESGLKKVKDAITNVTNAAVDTANKTLDINSPSGVFTEIGEFSGLGFVLGLRSMLSKIKDESKNVGKSAMDGINSAISKIVDVVNDDVDYSPVIRPVLDLDSLQNGMKDISDILNQENVLATKIKNDKNSRGINSEKQDDSTENKQGATYQFTQNNYSPKALSRLDIYRQTKNQFSAVKGMVNS